MDRDQHGREAGLMAGHQDTLDTDHGVNSENGTVNHGMFESCVPLRHCDLNVSLDSALQAREGLVDQDYSDEMDDATESVSTVSTSHSKIGKKRSFLCKIDPCHEVDVCFQSQKQLNIHHKEVHCMRFASGASQYKAHFSSFVALKKHKLLHDQTRKRFYCSHGKCKKWTLFRSEMAMHEHSDSQSRPYKYQHCAAEYKLKSDMTRHFKSHSTQHETYLYPECNYLTTMKRNMYEHICEDTRRQCIPVPNVGVNMSQVTGWVFITTLSLSTMRRKNSN